MKTGIWKKRRSALPALVAGLLPTACGGNGTPGPKHLPGEVRLSLEPGASGGR